MKGNKNRGKQGAKKSYKKPELKAGTLALMRPCWVTANSRAPRLEATYPPRSCGTCGAIRILRKLFFMKLMAGKSRTENLKSQQKSPR